MAGLVPDIRPEIFENLKAIALAMDATREDHRNTNLDSLRKFESLLLTYTPFDTSRLVSIVEKMILSALSCGKIMEQHDVKSLMANSAAHARQYRARDSQHIDELIKSAILARYGKIPTLITANAISLNIQSDVSRVLVEKNILKRGLAVSAITKRVQKLLALDD